MARSLRISRSTVYNTLWSALLQWSRVGVNAVVFLLISRWLTLDEIGAVAAITAPIVLLQTFQRGVIPDAVVQEADASDRKLSTLFFVSTAIGAGAFVLLLLSSGLVGQIIEVPNAGYMMATLSISPLLLGLSAVHEGILRKSHKIKALTVRTGVSLTLAAIPTIFMAANGFGAWSIVVYTVGGVALSSVITIWACQWKPSVVFCAPYFRHILPRLSGLVGRYALSAAIVPVLQLSIVVFLGAASGGIFQIAQRLLALIDSIIAAPIRFMALPLFAKARSGSDELSIGVFKAVTISLMIGAPVYFGLSAAAPILLPLLIGSNGEDAYRSFQILCTYGPAAIVSGIISQAMVSQGFAVAVFYRAAIMTVILIVPCALALTKSVEWVSAMYAIFGGYVGLLPTLFVTKRFLGVSSISLIGQSLLVIGPSVVASLAAWGLIKTSFAQSLPGGPLATLVLAGIVGLTIYLGSLGLTHRSEMKALTKMLIERRGARPISVDGGTS